MVPYLFILFHDNDIVKVNGVLVVSTCILAQKTASNSIHTVYLKLVVILTSRHWGYF